MTIDQKRLLHHAIDHGADSIERKFKSWKGPGDGWESNHGLRMLIQYIYDERHEFRFKPRRPISADELPAVFWVRKKQWPPGIWTSAFGVTPDGIWIHLSDSDDAPGARLIQTNVVCRFYPWELCGPSLEWSPDRKETKSFEIEECTCESKVKSKRLIRPDELPAMFWVRSKSWDEGKWAMSFQISTEGMFLFGWRLDEDSHETTCAYKYKYTWSQAQRLLEWSEDRKEIRSFEVEE